MKKCLKCLTEKPLSDFYTHKQMKDGHLNKCKECTKADTRANYRINHEYYRRYDRERAQLPHRVQARKDYAKTPEGRLAAMRGNTAYRRRNPDKYKAHTLVNNFIRDGLLQKKPCEVCGCTKNIHAHHEDYSKPLDVKWVCHEHHTEIHKAK